jgi:two-component system nitrate/nitrite response regulator NarL
MSISTATASPVPSAVEPSPAAQGLSAPEIAEQLFVGVTTVKTHLQHIYDKFDVCDRAAAVAQAHRRGLIT